MLGDVCRLDLTAPERRAVVFFSPDRPLAQWGSLHTMSAEVENSVPADSNPASPTTGSTSTTPPASPATATSKIPFKKEKKGDKKFNF